MQSSESEWTDALRRALASGSAASALSGVALSVCSALEERAPAGGLNGPSQWIWGEAEAYTRAATWKHTGVGYAIHHLTSIFWATLYERAFGRKRKSAARHCLEAAATAATAYIVDYHFTPSRFRPGFKKHLSPRSIAFVYAAFAAGMAAATLLRRRGARGLSHEPLTRSRSIRSLPAQ